MSEETNLVWPMLEGRGADGPSEEVAGLFDAVINPRYGNSRPLGDIEKEIKGTDLYSPENTLLVPLDEDNQGADIVPMGRNAVNFGVALPDSGEDSVRSNGPPNEGLIRYEDRRIYPVHFAQFPADASQRVMIVATHPDNEVVPFAASGHLRNRDAVKVVAVTDRLNDPVWKERMTDAYQWIGLKDDQYTFLGLPDTKLKDGEYPERLRSIFREQVQDFRPDTIIATPPGLNQDHNIASRVVKENAEKKNVNLLYGPAIEQGPVFMGGGEVRPFVPSVWQVIDGEEIDRAIEFYDRLGEGLYTHQVSNLGRGLPIAISKALSYAFATSEANSLDGQNVFARLLNMEAYSPDFMRDSMTVGAVGYMPVYLSIYQEGGEVHGYRVPHMTELFGLREYTKPKARTHE